MQKLFYSLLFLVLFVSLAASQIVPPRAGFYKPPGSSFSPSSLNFDVWIEADGLTGLANNDPITTATDLSGNGNHYTQSTAGRKPLYKTGVQNGKPAIEFDATDDHLIGPVLTISSTFTMYAVLKKTAVSSGYRTWACAYQKAPILARSSGVNKWGIYAGSDVMSSYDIDTFRIVAIVVRAANDIDLVTNGVTETKTNGSSFDNTVSQNSLSREQSVTQCPPMQMCAFFFKKDTAHNSTQIANMMTWLNAKYAVY